jgi:hypothetical protein
VSHAHVRFSSRGYGWDGWAKQERKGLRPRRARFAPSCPGKSEKKVEGEAVVVV